MNNDNSIKQIGNLNDNSNSNLTPNNNSLNNNLTFVQPQMVSNQSIIDNGQINNQGNNGATLSNFNNQESSNSTEQVINSINQVDNNSNSNLTPNNNSLNNNLTFVQPQMVNNQSIIDNGQINNQGNNGTTLSNFNNQESSNSTEQVINSINQVDNNSNLTPNNNSNIEINAQQQNIEYTNQTISNNNLINDEELLKIFIGKNYDKITTKKFNFAGLFFTSFYLFYRKMFLYGIILFLVNLIMINFINNLIASILFAVIVGLFVNKVYLSFANKKINKIKVHNSGKDFNELKRLCSVKGGTSIGKIFLGFFVELGIVLVVSFVIIIIGFGGIIEKFFDFSNWDIKISDDFNNSTLVEDVVIKGYSCSDSICNVFIEKSNNNMNYVFDANNIELFKSLSNYSDYIKTNIYYIQNDNEKTIIDYKIFLRSSNEEITNVETEIDLKNIIGLYLSGTYTENFTLKEIGMSGLKYQDDKSYTFTSYTLVDSNNNEYEMEYIIPDYGFPLDLIEGNKYSVTFEVVEDTFGYEFYIKSINFDES